MFFNNRTIENNLSDYVKYEKNATHETYFKIYNIKVSNKVYADIWLYNSNIMAQSDHDVLEHITIKSNLQQYLIHDVMKYEYMKNSFFYNA